jgi:hypothetical protein
MRTGGDQMDIETEDRNMDELMLQEYPGRIFEKNRKVRLKGTKRIYCYFGLQRDKFEEFVSKYKGRFSYKIHKFLGFPSESDKMEGVSLN